jgi:SAM-dependent methyltransferase
MAGKICTSTPSLSRIRDFLLKFDRYGGVGNESMAYLNDALWRFWTTLDMILQIEVDSGKLLELGAAPYFMTQLLEKFTSYEVTCANYFGEQAEGWEEYVQVVVPGLEYRYDHFNAERDMFPYDSGSFDVVLCCEVIEHLTDDPTHMLCEIHRVLKDGGYLLLTTPNVLRLQNILHMLRGRNIYDPYSGYGPYGRHNREYTPGELLILLNECGYQIVQVRLADKYKSNLIKRILKAIRSHWRDNIYILAQALGKPRYRYPSNLYRSLYGAMRYPNNKLIMCAQHRVMSNKITMGENDVNQIGYGWYELENLPPYARWTASEANAYLRRFGHERILTLEVHKGLLPRDKVIITLSIGDASEDFIVETEGWQKLQMILPPDLLNIVEMRITVDHTHNPAAMGLSKDTRDLGILVREIALL